MKIIMLRSQTPEGPLMEVGTDRPEVTFLFLLFSTFEQWTEEHRGIVLGRGCWLERDGHNHFAQASTRTCNNPKVFVIFIVI